MASSEIVDSGRFAASSTTMDLLPRLRNLAVGSDEHLEIHEPFLKLQRSAESNKAKEIMLMASSTKGNNMTESKQRLSYAMVSAKQAESAADLVTPAVNMTPSLGILIQEHQMPSANCFW
ncbi:hypothetical protein HAX54_010216 [Datura stramonium]|uniref:Uncharacterized protein n=1 Tax=Datura stramonium TaxID=4076 RepID=A0ABS8TFY9_DATST|nr:hypothetical protein [Datura stramonium]